MKRLTILVAAGLFATAALSEGTYAVHELYLAHRSVEETLNHMEDANKNHVDQFGGHEGKARQFLLQAKQEIEEADRFYTAHPH